MVGILKLITTAYAQFQKKWQRTFLTNFTTPVPGTLREVLDNDTTTRDKSYLNGLNMTKGESGGVSMMLKTGMEVAQHYNVFN